MRLLALVYLLVPTIALEVVDKGFKRLPGIRNAAGIHHVSDTKSTPPSTTTQKWYILLGDESKKDVPKDLSSIEGCPQDSQICGLTTVKVPAEGDKELVTEIIAFPKKIVPEFSVKDNEGILGVELKGADWGDKKLDASITMECQKSGDESMTATFDYAKLTINWRHNAFCKDAKDNGGDGNSDENARGGSHWGFFTWLFIIVVLVLAGYIIGQAWLNTSRMGGSGGDFVSELTDAVMDLTGKVPELIRQALGKLTGAGDRGGYSAV